MKIAELEHPVTDRLRVLRITVGLDPTFGGPSVSVVIQCLATQAAGIAHTLAYPFHPDMSEDNESARLRLSAAGVVIRRFPITRLAGHHSRRWAISGSLSRWLLTAIRGHDIVHVDGAWGAGQLCAVYVSKWANRPCVLSPHESLTEYDIVTSSAVPPWAKRVIRRRYMHRLALIVFSSCLEERDSMIPGAAARTVVLHHPVTDGGAAEARAESERESTLRVGFLGRLHPKKNVDLLLRALARIPDAELVIAGDGPQKHRQYLDAVVEQYRLKSRVRWLGFVSGAGREAFLDSVDVLAMPSAYECFGMAAAEAMARGVPTMVSTNCGIAEIVERNGCGVVVDPSLESWVEAITEFRNGANRAALSEASVETAKLQLSSEAFGKAMHSEYLALASGRTAVDV